MRLKHIGRLNIGIISRNTERFNEKMAYIGVDGKLVLTNSSTPEEANKEIGEYNKAHGTNFGWGKPAEGETNLSDSGKKVRDADVVQNPDGSYGIGKEYNKDQNNNQSSKVVHPNINNTNQVPDSNINIIPGIIAFLLFLLVVIVLVGFWIENYKAKRMALVEDEYTNNTTEETILPKEENHHKNDIREIKKLYDEGILTEEEFEKAKKKILDI